DFYVGDGPGIHGSRTAAKRAARRRPFLAALFYPVLFQIEGCRANAMMRGRPWPLQRGHCTSRSATRIDASGSRGFTRKSKSTTVLQLSQAIINQWCFDVSAAEIFGQNQT